MIRFTTEREITPYIWLQQPPAEPRLDVMHRITRRADPRLCEQTLVKAYTKIGNGSA
jgi:hypothetical protein